MDTDTCNYEFTCQLKQHTPMIHFQWQHGAASLRATELKPKLDKYLIATVGEDEVKRNGWFIADGTFPSLDYKVSITTPENDVWDFNGPNKLSIPMFFGNMDKNKSDNEKKRLVMCKKKNFVTLTFFSFHSDLIDCIKKHLDDFLLSTNFGTRQSKGFGSFYRKDAEINTDMFRDKFYLVIKASGKDPWHKYQDLFSQIDIFYKSLRSGLNHPHGSYYFRSLMYHYAIKEKSYYDKRNIRQYFQLFKDYEDTDRGEKFERRERHPWTEELKQKSRLYRDMLGLSSSQQWKYYNATITKEHIPNENNDTEIARFKSPITFKPLEVSEKEGKFIVLILPSEIPQGILGKKFKIRLKRSKSNEPYKGVNEGGNIIMRTPEKFDINDFLVYVLAGDGKEKALKQLQSDKNKKANQTQKLKKIFEEGIHIPQNCKP